MAVFLTSWWAGTLPGRNFWPGPHISIVNRYLRIEWHSQMQNWTSASLVLKHSCTLIDCAFIFDVEIPSRWVKFQKTTSEGRKLGPKLWGRLWLPSRVTTKNFTTDLTDNAWTPFWISFNIFGSHPGSWLSIFVTKALFTENPLHRPPIPMAQCGEACTYCRE